MANTMSWQQRRLSFPSPSWDSMWGDSSPSSTSDDVPILSHHMPEFIPRDNSTFSSPVTNNSHGARIYISSVTASETINPTRTEKMDTIVPVVHSTYTTLTSKTAQRTLLTTILATITAVTLYVFAALAYILVYNTYLPDQITTIPIHLNYGTGPNPWAMAPLKNMKEHQAYDIALTLTLPTCPTNLDRGNFMIGLFLLDREGTATPDPALLDLGVEPYSIPTVLPTTDPRVILANRNILYAASRPALAPYTDPIVSLASKLLWLPSFVLFPRPSTVTLTVPLVERVSFPNHNRPSLPGIKVAEGAKSALPSALFVEIQSGQDLRVSRAEVVVTAQLAGVRWFMYRYRTASFLLGSAAFWGCEVVCMGIAWGVLATLFSSSSTTTGSERGKLLGSGRETKKIKQEEDEMSDTERTFPTMARQPPLRYESSGAGRVKSEKEEEGMDMSGLGEIPLPPGVEADDEDDVDEELDAMEDGAWRDSGIGTSYSDAGAGQGVRKRNSGRRGR